MTAVRYLLASVLAAGALGLGVAHRAQPGVAAADARSGEVSVEPQEPATGHPPAELRVPLVVRETAGVARTGEVVHSGIPLPRELGLRGAGGIVVVDARGAALPTVTRVLSRWPVPAGNGPVHWLEVSFPASVSAGGESAYTLRAASAAPAAASAPRLQLTRRGSQVVVDTGVARFELGADAGALFDRATAAGEAAPLVTGGALRAVVDAVDGKYARTRRLVVERSGPLEAVVVVDGVYDLPSQQGGAIASWRRYDFVAGSPTALVRQVVAWEGGGDCRGCGSARSGLRVASVSDELQLASGACTQLLLWGARHQRPLNADGCGGSLRQLLRPDRQAAIAWRSEAGSRSDHGAGADAGLLAASGAGGTVAVALRQMHRYEPQALRASGNGSLSIDVVDGAAWLAQHQGLFANLAVAVLPGAADARTLERVLWAPLNRPLRAWPAATWVQRAEALPDVPLGALPPALAGYDTLVPQVLERTLRAVDSEGLTGVQTFGVYPRYWGRWGSHELDCKGADPTPAEHWDDAYWCGTWTDYHNTTATADAWAMRTGDMQWLDEVAFPAAWRTLHTQMMQCAPGDDWFYCGQAPAGYGGYRADFNSSHAYFANLFDYYLLSGDETVLAALRRGADRHGDWAHARNDNVLRAASQWNTVDRFLGATGSPQAEERFRSAESAAIAGHYAELQRDGQRYGFWSSTPLDGPGTYIEHNLYAVALYDFENLWGFLQDTGDAPLTSIGRRPSEVLVALARTFADLAARLDGGDGSIDGRWPRALRFGFTGQPIGGTLTTVEPYADPEPLLFPGDKPAMAAFLARAAALSGDPRLHELATGTARFAIELASKERLPLGKLMGLEMGRLPAAVALLARPPKSAAYVAVAAQERPK